MRMRNLAQGWLIADSALLARAMANLVSNALRYGAAGSVVTVSSQVHALGLDIEVSNHGEPIGAEHLPRLFDRFYRCDPSRAQPTQSSVDNFTPTGKSGPHFCLTSLIISSRRRIRFSSEPPYMSVR